MTVTIDGRTSGTVVYKESFWTGKRQLWYNGVQLRRQSNKQFFLEDSGGAVEFRVDGNRFTGVRIVSQLCGEPLQVTRKLAVWEYILAVLVFIPGVLFGAIGGAIGGILGYVNLEMMIRVKSVWLRVVLSIEMMIVCALISYGIALLFLLLVGSSIGWGIVG